MQFPFLKHLIHVPYRRIPILDVRTNIPCRRIPILHVRTHGRTLCKYRNIDCTSEAFAGDIPHSNIRSLAPSVSTPPSFATYNDYCL
eukprot:1322782-Amorphochlora_amoeboformis.AAC.1